MPRIRAEKTGKCKISKHEFYTCYHFALQYQEWLDRYNALGDSVKAITSDGLPHGNSTGDPTQSLAMKRAELKDKMELVDECIAEATEYTPLLAPYLKRGVTCEGVTYNYLRNVMMIPCGHRQYYEIRQRFYYILSKKMKVGHSGDKSI